MKRLRILWPQAAAMLACSFGAAGGAGSTPELAAPLAPVPRITGKEIISGPKATILPGGVTVQTLILRQTRWALKDLPQSAELSSKMEVEAMRLPEEKRRELMNRTDDHIQLWLVSLVGPAEVNAAWKPQFRPQPLSNQYHRELAFLGTGSGYAWFGWMPIYEWIHLQTELRLEHGDDPLAGAARGLGVEDLGSMTANSTEGYLSQAGARALPCLKPLLASTNTFHRALSVLSRIPGPEATGLLLTYAVSTDRQAAARARYLLAFYPRPEAEESYFKWLEEDAGRAPVLQLMEACARINQPRLAPLLPRILAAPKSVHELRRAFELSRSLSGRTIPVEILKAEESIKVHGYRNGKNFDLQKVDAAAADLIHSPDTEAAGCIGVSLALATTKGDWGPANQAGLTVLKGLPNGQGRRLAGALYDSCDDAWVRERLSGIVSR
jgi:hypothetical protein